MRRGLARWKLGKGQLIPSLSMPWIGVGQYGIRTARMTGLIYVVTVRGLIPESLPRKIAEAHAKALKSKHYSHTRCGKDLTPSKAATSKQKTIGT